MLRYCLDTRTFALLKDSYETSNTFNPDDYDHIIVACGYRMKTIPIFDRNGVELSPTSDDSGSCVGADGRLFPDHQIYAFGLGADLRTNKETGGECTRRANGIWLYQYAVGSIIRNSIKQRSMEWMRIYNRIGSNASVDTPLHHIGGYNMFTQQEWDDQVRDLLKHCGIVHLNPSTAIFESGCGGGAFLDSLRRLYGCEEVEGNDQASACVDIASSRLLKGKFWVGDAADLSRVPNASKHFSCMYGVTPYLNDEEHVEKAIRELLRITKTGGTVLIAENNVLQMSFPKAKIFDHDTIGREKLWHWLETPLSF